MRTFILSSIVFIIISVMGNNTVCPTPATIAKANDWELGSIYEITISDNRPRLRNKEVLLSAPLMEAINSIRTDDNTAYGDYAIEYSYVDGEDLYIANLLDEFKEL